MKFKFLSLLISVFIVSIPQFIFASDCPIIFIHGHKSEGITIDTVYNNDGSIKEIKGGLTTWYPLNPDWTVPYPTAMIRIIEEHYGGYDWGITLSGQPARCCDINTQLMPGQGKKRIFNYSYYDPNGEPGVIGIPDSVLVLIPRNFAPQSDNDTLEYILFETPEWYDSKDDTSNWIQIYVPKYQPY